MTPEIRDSFFLAHDHVRVGTFARDLRERCERAIRNRFHQRCVTHQSDAFELPIQVATTVERAAIERADDSVVVNQAHHRHRMNRTLGQELENFRCIAVRQTLDTAPKPGPLTVRFVTLVLCSFATLVYLRIWGSE